VRLSPGKPHPDQLTVSTNDREVGAEMTRYLASLGHRKIAFITGHHSHKAVANRFAGYKDGLQQSNLKYSERLIVAGDNSFGSGEVAAEKLLRRKVRPTAIFAANDDMAVAVIRVANRLGIKMPGELSVAGFDDIALARLVFPNLTTIRQPLSTMAERAASMLIRGDKSGVEIVPATLEIRESTGPLSA
jgi:LacI family transcriptional regulator